MDLLNGLTPDETAVIGCAAALLVSGTVMSLSYYVGRFLNRTEQTPDSREPHTLKMPEPRTARVQTASEPPLRRAA